MHRLCPLFILFGILTLAFQAAASEPGANPVPYNSLEIEFVTTADGIDLTLPHLWDFGDGHTSTEINPTHAYNYPGRYRVTLSINQGPPDAVVINAGETVIERAFESWPSQGWAGDPFPRSVQGAIVGNWGHHHNLTYPETTCSTPDSIPLEEGGDDPLEDFFRSWVLSLLIGTENAPTTAGSWFEILAIRDIVHDLRIFGVQLRYENGGYEVQAYAEENSVLGPGMPGSTRLVTPWESVQGDELRIELQGWVDHQSLPQGGGLRLRVLEHPSGQELVNESIAQLDNDMLLVEKFEFGVLESAIGQTTNLRLDEYQVQSATCSPPSNVDLLGHWDFNDANDLGLDSSENGLEGSPTGGVSGVVGRPRTPLSSEPALGLDGTGFIKIPNQGENLSGAEEVTIEAWIKVASHSQFNVFRSQQPLGLYSDRIAVSNYATGTGWETLTANPAPPLDEWYHLAGVFDDGELTIYVNGEEAGSRVLSFDELQGSAFVDWAIGARTPGAVGPDQFFTGEIDDVKLYRRALSEIEISAAAGLCSD